MIRVAGAATVLFLPGFVLSFLLALGERDWFHCFSHAETSDSPPLPSLFASGEFTPVLLETLTPPLSHWILALAHFDFSALAGYEPPANAREDWSALVGLLLALASREVEDPDWQDQVEAVRRWYQPQLERLYDSSETREADLEQLQQIAGRYPRGCSLVVVVPVVRPIGRSYPPPRPQTAPQTPRSGSRWAIRAPIARQ